MVIILFSRNPGGKYKKPNLKVKDNNIVAIETIVSEASKIHIFKFHGNDVILLIKLIITFLLTI